MVKNKILYYYRLTLITGFGAALCFLIGCGVKSDPLPLNSPPPLSHGKFIVPRKLYHSKRLNKYKYKEEEDQQELDNEKSED